VSVDGPQVATRLLRLSLRPDGRLAKSPLLAATARAALLADLAEHGALTSGPAGLQLDTTRTGFEPADRLLTGVAAQPDQTLEWWVRRGPATCLPKYARPDGPVRRRARTSLARK
jgi:hypothetical protein